MSAGTGIAELVGVWKRYGREWILKDLNLRVAPGEVVALLGPNGSGKTTLLRILATLIRPQRGEVRLFGRPARALEAERGALALMANPPAFYRHLSGEENLAQALALSGRGVRRDDVMRALEAAHLPPGRPVAAYSSGMKKRLALARVWLLEPRLLLLDEPETALDQAGRGLLAQTIQRVAQKGAVVLATHDQAFAEAVAHRAVELEGRA